MCIVGPDAKYNSERPFKEESDERLRVHYMYHLWSKCPQKGGVACPWVNKNGAGGLFLHKGGCLNGVCGSHKFQGVSNLEEVYIVRPVLHNTKGAASRILGVIGRTLPASYNHELLHVIAQVARRYDPGSLPPDSRQHMRHVRGRFQAGISLTGREARTVMGRLAGGMVLPLPFHSLVLAFCHMVHLCYGSNNLASFTWQGMGMLYTYIVNIIPECAEEGCTATLYMHGWSQTWFNRRAPKLYSDEASERDLRVAKRYALVTSTRHDASISESLKHALYQKFVQKKKKIPCAKIWAPKDIKHNTSQQKSDKSVVPAPSLPSFLSDRDKKKSGTPPPPTQPPTTKKTIMKIESWEEWESMQHRGTPPPKRKKRVENGALGKMGGWEKYATEVVYPPPPVD